MTNTGLSFFSLPLLSVVGSITKKGPIAMYTAWMMMLSDIAIVSADISCVMRGMALERAWNVSARSRRS